MDAVRAVPGRTADYTLPKTYPKVPQNAWAGRQKSSGSHDSDSPPDRNPPAETIHQGRCPGAWLDQFNREMSEVYTRRTPV